MLLIGFYQTICSQETIYVSPDGNDHASGSIQSPYSTIQKAIEGRLGNQFTDTLFIHVKPGNYYLSSPISINQPTSRPVVIRSTSASKPRILGWFQVKNWVKTENDIYKAYIPEIKSKGFYSEQFYVNGKKATLARTPNEDWFEIDSCSETAFAKGSYAADYAVQKVFFKPGDLSTLKNLTEEDLLTAECFVPGLHQLLVFKRESGNPVNKKGFDRF